MNSKDTENILAGICIGIMGTLSILGLASALEWKRREKISFRNYAPEYIKNLAEQEIESPGSIVDTQTVNLSNLVLDYIEANPIRKMKYDNAKRVQEFNSEITSDFPSSAKES